MLDSIDAASAPNVINDTYSRELPNPTCNIQGASRLGVVQVLPVSQWESQVTKSKSPP